jgi:ribosomal protein S15P/S13E
MTLTKDEKREIVERRRLLNYLQKRDVEGYRALIKDLGLRR